MEDHSDSQAVPLEPEASNTPLQLCLECHSHTNCDSKHNALA